MREIGIAKFKIILIVNYACNSKEELLSKEDEYIRSLKPELNMVNAIKNEEKFIKDWRYKNKYLVECECGLSYQKLSEARHKKEQAHLEFLNPKLKEERQNNIQKQKDETEKRKLEKSKIQITCQCGGHYSGHHKRNRHERTEQHQNYMSFKQKFKDLIEKYKNLNVF